MTKTHITLMIVSIYAALLTGYVGGVSHTSMSYLATPLFMHSWAKQMQEEKMKAPYSVNDKVPG